MELNYFPRTTLGKWSVGLGAFFLITIIISILLVSVLGVLSYDDRWWDVTVALIFPASIASFILGLAAIKRNKESSAFVWMSVVFGILAVLFILLHSLFIND